MDCVGKLVPVNTVMWFYAHIDGWHTLIGEAEDFVLDPFGDREPVQ